MLEMFIGLIEVALYSVEMSDRGTVTDIKH